MSTSPVQGEPGRCGIELGQLLAIELHDLHVGSERGLLLGELTLAWEEHFHWSLILSHLIFRKGHHNS